MLKYYIACKKLFYILCKITLTNLKKIKVSTHAYLERDGFHVRQLHESLQLMSCCNVH